MKRVPVLSKTIALTLLIFSNTEFFLIKIEFFIAILRVTTITEGIAKPSAQGPKIVWKYKLFHEKMKENIHEATITEINLSTGKHQTQY